MFLGEIKDLHIEDFFFTQKNSADSGPEKPENPNFENETRQTRTRNLLKYANPIKPEPEL